MKRLPVVLVLTLGIVTSSSGIAQSIGPDGRVLPIYSGGHAATSAPATTVVTNNPAPPTVTTPPVVIAG
jgi:hypothetical protein